MVIHLGHSKGEAGERLSVERGSDEAAGSFGRYSARGKKFMEGFAIVQFLIQFVF